MEPSGILQIFIVERLRAQADAIHAGPAVLLELCVGQRARVGFEADFTGTFGQRFENLSDRFAIQDRWRAAAEKYRFRLSCKF